MKRRVIIALSSVALLALLFTLVSGAGLTHVGPDIDGDGVSDDPNTFADNCTAIPNPEQRDEDGYGNVRVLRHRQDG